ncbi:MAG: threonylcarbamoyl-AMP synthase [Deltaproteobacteria bacterium]|nr:MAG: threonylcarbamoyl-AMP synthase [Deltaproteobacteria bacterium]
MNKKPKSFANKIRKAAHLIKDGGIVVFPTRCLYGLGADAFDTDAVERIFEIKQRPSQKPILILIDHQDAVKKLVQHVPRVASLIMEKFWPGKVTIVFEAKDSLSSSLTAGTGKIGIRQCGHPVAAALVRAVGGPVTGTSANIAGEAGCSRISDLSQRVGEKADLVLDAGPLEGGKGSTVIDVTSKSEHESGVMFPWTLLREGLVPEKSIIEIMNRRCL